jgi:hypothetical protein
MFDKNIKFLNSSLLNSLKNMFLLTKFTYSLMFYQCNILESWALILNPVFLNSRDFIVK